MLVLTMMLGVCEHHMQQCRLQSVLRDSAAGLLLSPSRLARFRRCAHGGDVAAYASVRKYALESAMASVVGLPVEISVSAVLLVMLKFLRRRLMLTRRSMLMPRP